MGAGATEGVAAGWVGWAGWARVHWVGASWEVRLVAAAVECLGVGGLVVVLGERVGGGVAVRVAMVAVPVETVGVMEVMEAVSAVKAGARGLEVRRWEGVLGVAEMW